MKAENSTLLYIVIALLSLIVIAQGYVMYALRDSTHPVGFASHAHSDKGLHRIFDTPAHDPFKEIQRMQEEMRQNFGQFNSIFANDPLFKGAYEPILPMSDIKENENNYILELNIPGADEQEIKITAEDQRVQVYAKGSSTQNNTQDNYLHKETFSHNFARSFTLPQNADTNRLSHTYEKGILKITVPKK